MICVICGVRKAKRACPGVRGEICTICCGTEREQTVDCPLDCEFLHTAHQHERVPPVDPATVPNRDLEVKESFLQQHDWLMVLIGSAVLDGARASQGATDLDARAGLESLIQTYRAATSGLVVETRPANPYAARIHEQVEARLAELRKIESEAKGSSTLRDSAVLGVLVFLQRLEYARNNQRKKSRAFLDFLGEFHVDMKKPDAETLVEPSEPRVIL